MKHGSLFSGIGAPELAASWMGWENVFHCEINPFGRRVLHYYYPNAISYEDITKTDFTVHRGTIDILTGGFPCQPYSAAGKRLGKEDERHLWPQMLRAFREIQPTWGIGENVPGLVNWNDGMVFDEVQADLEAEGYEVIPFLLPACGVNAPHRRERIFFIAYSNRNRIGQEHGFCSGRNLSKEWINEKWFAPDPAGHRWQREGQGTEAETGLQKRPGADRQLERGSEGLRISWPIADTQDKRYVPCSHGFEQGGYSLRHSEEKFKGFRPIIAESPCNGQPGKEYRETQAGRTAKTCFSDYWEEFPTQSPVCGRDDGLSSRLSGITVSKHRDESIKAYGNAIVPQVIYQIFQAIEQFEKLNP